MSADPQTPRAHDLRLWHRPGSRSGRVLWLLEELGVPYALEVVTREQSREATHRRRHPLGRVPVLEWNGDPIFESGAICLSLADAHPSAGLLARKGPARAYAFQWSVFAVAEIDPRVLLALTRDAAPGSSPAPVGEAVEVLAAALARTDHLAGDSFSVADLLCATGLDSIARFGLGPLPGALTAWLERLDHRAARVRARKIDAGSPPPAASTPR